MSMTRTVAALLMVAFVGAAQAAPVPATTAAKAKQWEYCELQQKYLGVNVRPIAIGGGAGGAGAGGMVAKATVRLITPDAEVETAGWEDLAAKLKAPAGKIKSATAAKVRVLNQLGADGWELVTYHREYSTGFDVWTFKRKAGN